jgi:hypothetical protein
MQSSAQRPTVLDEALRLAKLGLRVVFAHGVTDSLDCQCGNAHTQTKSSIGKHPRGLSWQRKATTDPQAIRDLYVGGSNLGIVCGEQPSIGFVIAVDIDDEARFAQLVADCGELPETLTGRSPRGERRFFLVPEAIPNKSLDGVDIKGKNGFCVVGPSRHHSGGYYTELTGTLAQLPPSWLTLIRPIPKPPLALSSWEPTDKRARTRAEKWARSILVKECRLLAQAAEGTRNHTLHHAALRAFSCFRGVQLPESEAHQELYSAAKAAGLPELETRRTLASVEKHLDATGEVRKPIDRPKLELVHSAPGPIELLMDRNQVCKIAENVRRMLEVYPGGPPRYDEFSDSISWPSGKRLKDADIETVQGWLYAQPDNQRVRSSTDATRGGIVLSALGHAHHVVRDYLGRLEWDKQPRVEWLFSSYFGAPDSPYVRAVSRCFLIGSVARVMRPGCKLDTMPVLEGAQGTKKSTGLNALAGGWFSDTPFVPGEKDSYQALIGVWIHEMAELASVRGRESERVKAFLSSPTDRYRKSYGRITEAVPRQCAFVGTTNPGTYLSDDTGARRQHPVPTTRVDVEAIAKWRDQIWAEARTLFDTGNQWWLSSELEATQAEIAEARRFHDPWEEDVATLPRQPITLGELLGKLGVESGRRAVSDDRRLTPLLRRYGWTPRQAKKNGIVVRFWVPGDVVG